MRKSTQPRCPIGMTGSPPARAASKPKTAKAPPAARKAQPKVQLVGGFPAKIAGSAAVFDPSGNALYVLRPLEGEGWRSRLLRFDAGAPTSEVEIAVVPSGSCHYADGRVIIQHSRGVAVVDADGQVRSFDLEEDSHLESFACKDSRLILVVDVGPGEQLGARAHQVRMFGLDGALRWSITSKEILFGSYGIGFSTDGRTVFSPQHDTARDVPTLVRWDASTGVLEGVEVVEAGTGTLLSTAANGNVVTSPFANMVCVHRPDYASAPNGAPILVAKPGTKDFVGFESVAGAVATDRELLVLCAKGERSLLFRRPFDGGAGEVQKCPLRPRSLALAPTAFAIVGRASRGLEVHLFALD